MQIDHFKLQHPPSLASLRAVLSRTSEEFQVSWFGLVCGGTPAMTLGLSERRLVPSDWQIGQELVLRVPFVDGARESVNVEFQCSLDEIRDWYGKTLLRARLLKAAGPGRQLVGRALNQLCQGHGWRLLFT